MVELWKQCGDWLCRLEVLPPNHRITWPDATVQDLAYALRDGVLLCHLLHKIDPATLEMRLVNQRPALAQFLCLKNIRLFLTACTRFYDMRETDLFQPSMLYDYTDFAQVLHSLSRLSQSSRAVASGQYGFPVTEGGPSHDEEQIYRTLEELVTEDQYAEFYYKHHGASGFGRRDSQYFGQADKEEDIYEDLCSFNGRGSKKLQSDVHNFQPKEKRDYILKELLETEFNYVEVLNMLRKHFIRSITCIKDVDKKIIFMNIKELGETHGGFHKDILEAVIGKSRKRVGEVFLEYKERFLKYGEYCSELPKAHQLLETLCAKDEVIKEEVARCEQNVKDGKFRLGDLLAVPMQRILKYHLLLRELLQHTPQSHDEYHTIQQGYEAMLDVSDFVNEVKRDSEQLQVIREIQVSITDWNMPPGIELKDYGRLRKDSELKIQSHDASGKNKVRYVFVFDKMILICKATRGDHYSFKDSLKVQDYKVQDVSSRRFSRDTRWAYSFMLVHKDNLHAYTMFARTEDDKNKWISGIQEAVLNVFPAQREQSTHEAVMHTFEKPSSCSYCHKLLKGLFFQGYRCEKCQRGMHKECISLMTKCGNHSQPPAPPPRPISMQLPSPVTEADRQSLLTLTEADRQSVVSLEEQLAFIPGSTLSLTNSLIFDHSSLPPLMSNNKPFPDYVNTRIEEHAWYVGELDRETANTWFSGYPSGTYFVRARVQGGEQVGYALSLRLQDDTKHMKICTGEHDEWGTKYYLSDSRFFRSIVELVSWYSHHSLKESFSGLDTVLRFPYKEISLVEAVYDFTPDWGESNMLNLRTGDRLAVIDKMGDGNGWWKAVKENKIGYIPKDFVKSLSARMNM